MNKQIKEEKNCFLRDYSLQKEVEKLDLSEKIRAQLNLANIRILLPKKDISKKNNRFNVFVSEALEISGEYRVCYLEIDECDIKIAEFKGARGDRYSGFYKMLVAFLDGQVEYKNEKNKLILKIQELERLLNIFNDISCLYKDGKCEVRSTAKTFTKKIGGESCEYPIKYYELIDNKIGKELDVIHKTWIDIRTEIEEQCKVLIEGTGDQFVSAYKEIQQMKQYLEKILNDNNERKLALEKNRGIQF